MTEKASAEPQPCTISEVRELRRIALKIRNKHKNEEVVPLFRTNVRKPSSKLEVNEKNAFNYIVENQKSFWVTKDGCLAFRQYSFSKIEDDERWLDFRAAVEGLKKDLCLDKANCCTYRPGSNYRCINCEKIVAWLG